MKKLMISTLLGTALIMGAPLATAQGGYQQQGAPAQQPEVRTNFDDRELETFANLSQDIYDIQVEYQQKIQATETEDEATSLLQEAQGKMIEVIDSSPLDRDTFNAIGQAYNTDPELRERVNQLVETEEAE